jgi:hypothetical protein
MGHRLDWLAAWLSVQNAEVPRMREHLTPKPHPFWDSEAGKRLSDARLRASMLQLRADVEPRSKRARSTTNDRAQLLDDALLWHQASWTVGGRWPRPRAELAVDLLFVSASSNPPRIDSACKWLLDELGSGTGKPIVYNDDRQIKMLYARIDKSSAKSCVYVRAQTLSKTFQGIRRGLEVGRSENRRELYTDFNHAEDWEAFYEHDQSDYGREWLLRSRVEKRLDYQQVVLRLTDDLVMQVIIARALDRSRYDTVGLPGLRHASDCLGELLKHSRLAVRLGRLPSHGQSEAFRAGVRKELRDLAAKNPLIFPLLPSVGLSLFYIESPTGKDLDNIVRTVLPIVIDELSPPADGIGWWDPLDRIREWETASTGGNAPIARGVQFVEAVALPAGRELAMEPGSLLMALSRGDRLFSTWIEASEAIRDLDYRDT